MVSRERKEDKKKRTVRGHKRKRLQSFGHKTADAESKVVGGERSWQFPHGRGMAPPVMSAVALEVRGALQQGFKDISLLPLQQAFLCSFLLL